MKKLLLNVCLLLILVLSSTSVSANNNETTVLAPPDNDLIENATDLALRPFPFIDSDVNFPEATLDGGEQQGGCTMNDESVWYKFTATKTGVVGAGVAPANTPIVVFYSASNANVTNPNELTYVDSANNICGVNTPSSIEAIEGTTYYIYVSNSQIADVTINVSEAFAAPINDHITNAINIGNETPPYIDENVHILAATNTDDGGQVGCTTAGVPAIWYKFTAEQDGQFSVFITENGQQNGAVVYTADDLNATSGTELTYLDSEPVNFCGPSNDALIEGIEGQSYYIVIISASPYVTIGFDISLTLGTTENTLEGFTYYPNPISNEINLQAQSNIDEVTIVNILGQVVYSEKVGTSTRTINLSHLSKGLYIMNVTSEGASGSYKVIKR